MVNCFAVSLSTKEQAKSIPILHSYWVPFFPVVPWCDTHCFFEYPLEMVWEEYPRYEPISAAVFSVVSNNRRASSIFKSVTYSCTVVKGQEYCVRVDAFNENGITHGMVSTL